MAVCENRICPGEIEFPPPPISQVFGVTVAHVHVHPSRTFCRKLTRESRVSPRHLGETRAPSYFPQLEKCEQIFDLPNKTGKQTLCPGEILFCPLQIQKFKQFPHIQFCISFFGYEESRNGNCMENRKAKNEIISEPLFRIRSQFVCYNTRFFRYSNFKIISQFFTLETYI